MAKVKPTEIKVTTVFDGKQDGRQAFIELILQKRREEIRKNHLDYTRQGTYNGSKVFSDVHVG